MNGRRAPVNLESPPGKRVAELELWREVLLLAIMDCRGQLVGVDRHGAMLNSARRRGFFHV
jgi:hypothetical protein